MIDYEKLKIAHELALKVDRAIKYIFGNSIANTPCHQFYIQNYTEEERCDDIDDLISKLQELIQPEPKYKAGDQLWFVDYSNKPTSIIVQQSRINQERIEYLSENYLPLIEAMLFPTKEALIESQIEYWESLHEPEGCQHESDGIDHFLYSKEEKFRFPVAEFNKCTKCGEFYK